MAPFPRWFLLTIAASVALAATAASWRAWREAERARYVQLDGPRYLDLGTGRLCHYHAAGRGCEPMPRGDLPPSRRP